MESTFANSLSLVWTCLFLLFHSPHVMGFSEVFPSESFRMTAELQRYMPPDRFGPPNYSDPDLLPVKQELAKNGRHERIQFTITSTSQLISLSGIIIEDSLEPAAKLWRKAAKMEDPTDQQTTVVVTAAGVFIRVGMVTDKVGIYNLGDYDLRTTFPLSHPIFANASVLGPPIIMALQGANICSQPQGSTDAPCTWSYMEMVDMKAEFHRDPNHRLASARHFILGHPSQPLVHEVAYKDHDNNGLPTLITIRTHNWSVKDSEIRRNSWKVLDLEIGSQLDSLKIEDVLGTVPGDRVIDSRYETQIRYNTDDGKLLSHPESLALAESTARSIAAGRQMEQAVASGQLIVPASPSHTVRAGLSPWLDWVRQRTWAIVFGGLLLGAGGVYYARRKRGQ